MRNVAIICMLFFIVPFLVASYPQKKIDNQNFIEPESVFVSDEQDNNKRVLYFGATWCSPCRLMKQVLKKENVKKELDKVDFIMYDIDKDKKEASKHKIKLVPTIIFLNGDKEKERTTGLVPEEKLIEKIKNL